jgi:hypothetical protein
MVGSQPLEPLQFQRSEIAQSSIISLLQALRASRLRWSKRYPRNECQQIANTIASADLEQREDFMHAVVRTYSGQGAKELFELLEQRKSEVEDLIRSVSGFQAYTLIRTDDGGVTVTVCQDKAGTDHSLQLARDWIQQNASDLGTSSPAVSEGSVVLNLS